MPWSVSFLKTEVSGPSSPPGQVIDIERSPGLDVATIIMRRRSISVRYNTCRQPFLFPSQPIIIPVYASPFPPHGNAGSRIIFGYARLAAIARLHETGTSVRIDISSIEAWSACLDGPSPDSQNISWDVRVSAAPDNQSLLEYGPFERG